MNNAIPLENSSDIKEEFQDVYYPDNKICFSETSITDTINTSNSELNAYYSNVAIRKYEMLSVDHIKTDLPSSEINDIVRHNVKIKDGINHVDTQIEFCNELLFCNHCHEVYHDYCTKCRVLVHILNKRPPKTYNRVTELPKKILESRELTEHLRIFSLKVIPENVRFGPFTGLNFTGLPLRIKGGRFVLSDDKSENLNWMQYINPARNIYEQNLLPFQYEDRLYYVSTRRIQEGEELLVYFGEKYEDNLLENMEMDFVPIAKEDLENVFACTFCCLGFSSKEYLAEHKAAYHSETNEMFAVKELAQCSFCKIYLEAKEYLEHHMDYCRETSARYCILPSREVHKRSSLRRAKTKKRGIYKSTQSKFKTLYNTDFRQRTNMHCEVKMYKCGICDRRYKTKESLKAHVEKIHADNKGTDVQKYCTSDYSRANIKNINERSRSHRGEKRCQSSKRIFQTRHKYHLKESLIKIKDINRGKYKCAHCEFKTYYRTYLEMHMQIKHFTKSNYKCMECEYKTTRKTDLERHIKAKHLKLKDYKCAECEFQTSFKTNLKLHIKTKHLKLSDYKCIECEYQTNFKSNLELHIKSKHLKLNDYKCMECEYKTNFKSRLELHIKSKHLKLSDYKCMECEYQTNFRANLERHTKAKHLKLRDYKCMECEYQTNFKLNFELHMKSKHLKLSDYKCMYCKYQTNVKANLERHMKAKHLNLNDCKCMECEYQTNIKVNLERHMKAKHLKLTDYKCIECEYQTNIKANLERHMKAKHIKLNDCKCMECEYQTNIKANLERHMKAKHRKLRDYKCMECEYETNIKANLERHVKSKHPKLSDFKCMECDYQRNFKSNLELHIAVDPFSN